MDLQIVVNRMYIFNSLDLNIICFIASSCSRAHPGPHPHHKAIFRLRVRFQPHASL